MEFTLHYRGELRPNGDPAHKHELRGHFHRQLRDLWAQPPLKHRPHFASTNPPPGKISLLRHVDGFNFVPLVSEKLHAFAEISILLLRPGPPGHVICHGGDIDNRLKTLLDALKVPELSALPPKARPHTDEDPFYCLLEDDALVTTLSVTTDPLLDPSSHSEVILVLHVKTRYLEVIFANIGL